jgi:hypothetical protein
MTHFEAFVAFARSILHVLKNEVDEAGVFTCFEPEWNAVGNETLPGFLRDTRNIVLKEGVEGTGKRAEYTEVVTNGLLLRDWTVVEITRGDGTVGTRSEPPTPASEALGKTAYTAEGSARYFFTESSPDSRRSTLQATQETCPGHEHPR